MKITTLNSKNPNYDENHQLFVGTHTGSFKKLCVYDEDPHRQENLQTIDTLNKDSHVTAIAYSNDDQNEILIGRKNKLVHVYSADSNEFSSNVELTEGSIVGVGRYNNKIVAGFETGRIQMLQEPESIILNAGDHMSRMRQCNVDKKLIACGGKERQNNLKVFNLESGQEIFKSKNLPNDFLQLEVPVWDSDLGFIDANKIATCSRHRYVRLYDIRTQRRPILKYSTEEPWMFCSLIAKNDYIYTGTTMGVVKAFDIRKFKTFVHTYKGFVGTVSDLHLDDTGKYLASACLDRYARVHHTESCSMLYQCYVKSKATRILLRTDLKRKKNVNADDSSILLGQTNENAEEDASKDGSDDEYNDMFNNMPTICETDGKQQQGGKRKSKLKNEKNKKKKI